MTVTDLTGTLTSSHRLLRDAPVGDFVRELDSVECSTSANRHDDCWFDYSDSSVGFKCGCVCHDSLDGEVPEGLNRLDVTGLRDMDLPALGLTNITLASGHLSVAEPGSGARVVRSISSMSGLSSWARSQPNGAAHV